MGEESDDLSGFAGGSATTLNSDGKWKRFREFPPGFHGANPGPSHDDDAPQPAAAPRRAPASPKAAAKPVRRGKSTPTKKKKKKT